MTFRAKLLVGVGAALAALITLDVAAEEWSVLLRVLAAAVLAVVSLLAIDQLAQLWVASPLSRMTRAAQRVGRGEYHVELPPGPADELGGMARALVALSSHVETRMGELAAERDRLTAILEAMTEGVFLVDPGETVILANSSASRILDAPTPLVGRSLAEAVRHPDARAALTDALEHGRPAEVEIEGPGLGRAVVLAARALPAGAGAVAVVHDVTHLRRLETMRRDFVSNLSHELRTPVASIQGYAETLIDGALEDPANARRFVEVIHRNASRIGRLVADLLTLARLEARSPEQIVREPVPLREAADRVAETVREPAAAAGVEVKVEVGELAALGDPDGVEQLLLNLVDNAVKYGRKGGHVVVSVAKERGGVAVTVADDGPGIESRHLPRIFERFYRVDSGRDARGTGLGLAIVKHLAESMGGSVSVDSEIGRGSRFIVRLPAP